MDIETYRQPNILFLRGCFPRDCATIEDMFDERLIESVKEFDPWEYKIIKYDKIPGTFTSAAAWIRRTNLLCWHCDREFDTRPVFIPRSIDTRTTAGAAHGHMDTIGNFCSFSCAAAYVVLYLAGNDLWEHMNMLRILCAILTGRPVYEIAPAPPRHRIDRYGGDLTAAQYIAIIRAADDDIHVIKKSILPCAVPRGAALAQRGPAPKSQPT